MLYLLFLFLRTSSASVPEMKPTSVFIFMLLLITGIVLHEGLHAAGWLVFGKLPFSRVGFGFKLRTLTPYAHLQEPVQARTYRVGILLPLLVLGLPPYLLGIIFGRLAFMIYGLFFILAAGGDLLVLWLLRGLPADTWVEDHPTRAGCWVYRQPQSPDPARDDSN
ncbi:MAG: metalloprotease family protein [Anaerolineales bacterium]